jgi:hypothetical protein
MTTYLYLELRSTKYEVEHHEFIAVNSHLHTFTAILYGEQELFSFPFRYIANTKPLSPMKNIPLILAALLLLLGIQSCKKDDDSGPTGSGSGNTKPVAQLPPAGFSFPHTYYQQGSTDEFKIWIKGMDVSSKFKPQDIFERAELFPTFNAILRNQHTIEFIDPTGANQPETNGYFFYHDTLFIIGDDIDQDTFAFAKGNFSGFTISICEYMVTKQNSQGDSRYGGMDLDKMTYQKLRELGASLHIEDPDTMAYHNQSATLK